ncbi:unnamed protein product [Brassica napus]|uniref:(rape) hypothetical protein n=1 Tax=Brassica napus TaxID=3708 RepID=A0A816M0J5_BRANA|nr:unnamed protein product [Brassica napus]
MEYFLLLELREEIQVLVVERVARNSFQDLYGLKASSKSMKALAERRGVIHFYDFFFSFGLKEEGLSLMKRAADAGYERAVYTHAMTRAIFCSDGQYFVGIPRESVQRIRKLVRSVKWGWGLWHSDEFRQNRAVFVSAYVPSFYRCQCATHVERQCLCLWHIDMTKDDNMCEHCFLIKEIDTFLRDFEPISVIRDTRKW